MACKRATPWVRMMVVAVAVAAIVVAGNGRVCDAFDMGEAKVSVMNSAEAASEKASSWTSWAYNKISGKLSVNPGDMTHKTGSAASDVPGYVSGKVHAVSHSAVSGAKDSAAKFYAEAKRDAGPAFDSMATKTVHED